jgi:hypothetical protein
MRSALQQNNTETSGECKIAIEHLKDSDLLAGQTAISSIKLPLSHRIMRFAPSIVTVIKE